MTETRRKLILVSRGYCHLCDEMREAIYRVQNLPFFALEVIDVDSDEKLLELYDELVPVLLSEGREPICFSVLDPEKVREYLHSFD